MFLFASSSSTRRPKPDFKGSSPGAGMETAGIISTFMCSRPCSLQKRCSELVAFQAFPERSDSPIPPAPPGLQAQPQEPEPKGSPGPRRDPGPWMPQGPGGTQCSGGTQDHLGTIWGPRKPQGAPGARNVEVANSSVIEKYNSGDRDLKPDLKIVQRAQESYRSPKCSGC